FLHAT
ncbi:metallo-beta-lactamase superfamily protein, partial [Chlamydia psittaci 09DC78]